MAQSLQIQTVYVTIGFVEHSMMESFQMETLPAVVLLLTPKQLNMLGESIFIVHNNQNMLRAPICIVQNNPNMLRAHI